MTNIPSFSCSIYKEEGYYRLSILPVQCTNVSVRLSPKKKVFLGYYWIKKLNLEMGRMVGPNNKDQSPGRIRIDPNFRFRRVRFFALVIIYLSPIIIVLVLKRVINSIREEEKDQIQTASTLRSRKNRRKCLRSVEMKPLLSSASSALPLPSSSPVSRFSSHLLFCFSNLRSSCLSVCAYYSHDVSKFKKSFALLEPICLDLI